MFSCRIKVSFVLVSAHTQRAYPHLQRDEIRLAWFLRLGSVALGLGNDSLGGVGFPLSHVPTLSLEAVRGAAWCSKFVYILNEFVF